MSNNCENNHEIYAIWQSYLNAEKEIEDFLRYVPWVSMHREVYSEKLATILIDVGSQIDSILRQFINSDWLDGFQGIDEIRRKKKNNLNITDFQKVYVEILELTEKEIGFCFVLPNFNREKALKPWESAHPDGGRIEWWDAYNKVKHNRFEHSKCATLENTIMALGALFTLCVSITEIIEFLLYQGVIKSDLSRESLLYSLEDESMIIQNWIDVVAKTRIFYTFCRGVAQTAPYSLNQLLLS